MDPDYPIYGSGPKPPPPLMHLPDSVRRCPLMAAALLLTAAASAQSTTTRASTDSAGLQANGLSTSASVSASGRFVAFSSKAANLTPGDTNGVTDVFVKDRQAGAVQRRPLRSFRELRHQPRGRRHQRQP